MTASGLLQKLKHASKEDESVASQKEIALLDFEIIITSSTSKSV